MACLLGSLPHTALWETYHRTSRHSTRACSVWGIPELRRPSSQPTVRVARAHRLTQLAVLLAEISMSAVTIHATQ